MTTMTPEQIAGLEALLEQATPGEWKARKKQEDEDYVYGFDWYHYSDQYGVVGYWTGHKKNHKEERWGLSEADAHLIALAPTLARHVLTQQAQIERLEKALQAILDGNPTIDSPEDDAANSAAIARAALKGGDA